LTDEKIITLYGTRWCFDSRRSRRVLDRHNIPYTYIDIDENLEGRRFVEQVNRGFRSVPTIVFPDGSILVEPSDEVLRARLGIHEESPS
jgi:mycoredoxin